VGGDFAKLGGVRSLGEEKPDSPTKKQKKTPNFIMYIFNYCYKSKIDSCIDHIVHIVKCHSKPRRGF
jgi:hypothetical protein